MQKIKFFFKKILRENFFFSILYSKLSILFSYFYDGFLCRILKYDTYWLHNCSFGFIPYWHLVFRPEQKFSETTLVFFSKYIPKKGDIVLEFGAGIGNETLVLSKLVGTSGKIISLEPHPKIFDYLLKTLSFNKLLNVNPENKALSYSGKKLSFSDIGENWLKNKISENGPVSIETTTIEDLFDKYNIETINFLKCNIEGAEIELLKIEENNLKKIKNICIECHDFLDSDDHNLNTYNSIKLFLENNGFEIFEDYKKHNMYPHQNYYIYASKEKETDIDDYFYLRDKLDYVVFNKILRNIIKKR